MRGRRENAGRVGACAVIGLACLAGCSAPPSRAGTSAAPSSSVTAAVRIATDRSGLESQVVTLPNGMRMRRLGGGTPFNHVLIGRVDADGKRSIACVDSESGAEAFLRGGSSQGSGQ